MTSLQYNYNLDDDTLQNYILDISQDLTSPAIPQQPVKEQPQQPPPLQPMGSFERYFLSQQNYSEDTLATTPRCFYPTNNVTKQQSNFMPNLNKVKSSNQDFLLLNNDIAADYFNLFGNSVPQEELFTSPLSSSNVSPTVTPNTVYQQATSNMECSPTFDDITDLALDEVILTQQSFVYPTLTLDAPPVLESINNSTDHNIEIDEVSKVSGSSVASINTDNVSLTPRSSIDENEEEDDDEMYQDDEDYEEGHHSTHRSIKQTKRGSTAPNSRRNSKSPKLFKCDACSSSFTRKTRLTEHKNRVHLGKVYHFECKTCGVQLSSKENLTRHKIVHTDKFKCGKCNRRFDRSYRFHRHVEKCDGSH